MLEDGRLIPSLPQFQRREYRITKKKKKRKKESIMKDKGNKPIPKVPVH